MIEYLTTSMLAPETTKVILTSYWPALLPSILACIWLVLGMRALYIHYVDTGNWFPEFPDRMHTITPNLLLTILQVSIIWCFGTVFMLLLVVFLYPMFYALVLFTVITGGSFYYAATRAHRKKRFIDELRGSKDNVEGG